MLKFAVNFSFLFQEVDFLQRFHLAGQAGFKAVETNWTILDYDVATLLKTMSEAGVELIHFVAERSTVKDEEGIIGIPGREADFLVTADRAFKHAKALNCHKILFSHGFAPANPADLPKHEHTIVENLKKAGELAKQYEITVLLEPLCRPGVFVNSLKFAMSILKQVNMPNVKLQFDFYHAQKTDGNLTEFLRDNFDYVDHIQFGQVPDRHEPDSPGELNFDFLFGLLEELKYAGWVSAEYFPIGKTEEGLGWLQKYSNK